MFLYQKYEFWAFGIKFWTSNTILEISEFDLSAWARKASLERKNQAPRRFAENCTVARAANLAAWENPVSYGSSLERQKSHSSVKFMQPVLLQRFTDRLSEVPYFRNFWKPVWCSNIRSPPFLSILRQALSILNELKGMKESWES